MNQFTVGRVIANPKTLEMSKAEVYRKTVGVPSVKAVRESGGDFTKYITKRGVKSLTGKAFEARTAIKLNRLLAKSGSGDRLLITAAEGFPTDVADLARVSANGEIKELYQLKLSPTAAKSAVGDTRYIGMTLVTTPDSFQAIQKELRKETLMATQKGKPLPPKWQGIHEAIQDGRLTDKIAGRRVPSFEQAEKAGIKFTETMFKKSEWDQISKASMSKWVASGKTASKVAGTSLKVAGPAIFLIEAYSIYRDFYQYRNGTMTQRQFYTNTAQRGGGAAGAWAGAWVGGEIGSFGGPFAWITIPAGGLIGGIVGYFAGSSAAGYLANSWYGSLDQKLKERVLSEIVREGFSQFVVP